MAKTRTNLSDTIDDMAPSPPPCFHNFLEWSSYLKSAAAAQNQSKDEPKIIIMVNGEPTINLDYPFCVDCTAQRSLKMSDKGMCRPDHLKDLKP